MATLLIASGETRLVTPATGVAFTLTEMQQLVGGYIEVVPIGGTEPRYLVLNEDGKRLQLPPNPRATAILHAAGGLPDDVCVGDAVVVTRAEMGEEEEEA